MKLVLHIGAHKTATTTIQKVLAGNRENLLKSGIWYPAYSEIFPEMSDHYAHLDLAKGLMSNSKKFTPDKVADFFVKLQENAAAVDGTDTIIISSEPFYRGQAQGDEPYWERRERYVRDVRSAIPFEDTEVVLVLRRQDDYLESLYNEHVKVTRYAKDIWDFLADYHSRFEYKQQIQLWSKYFPALKVATFEELVKSGGVTREFLNLAVGQRDVSLEDVGRQSNTSLPVDLLEFKRLLNGTSLSRSELDTLVPILDAMARARTPGDSGRVSRLSEEDCLKVLSQFEDDNAWINDTFFAARPGGLFPSEIKVRTKLDPLDAQACAHIVTELVRYRKLLET